jgi:hypothetical protein
VAVAEAGAARKLAHDAIAEAAAAERAEAAAAVDAARAEAAAAAAEWPGFRALSGRKVIKAAARKHKMVIHLMQQLMPVVEQQPFLGVEWCCHSTLVSTLSMASPSSTHYGVRPLTYPTRITWESMLEASDADPNDLRSWWADTMWGTVSHAVTRSMHPPPPYHPPTHSRFSKW